MLFAYDAESAVKIKNNTASISSEQSIVYDEDISSEEAADIATLENDIRILDEELAKCKKQKKGWIAATVIGAAGVVATGTAAAVQGVKLKDKKSEYSFAAGELAGKQDKLKELNKEADSIK